VLREDAEEEIEKLKMRKVELTNRLNLVKDYDEREQMKADIEKIQMQIKILERMKSQ